MTPPTPGSSARSATFSFSPPRPYRRFRYGWADILMNGTSREYVQAFGFSFEASCRISIGVGSHGGDAVKNPAARLSV
jgi:hypothetical protein